ncbi:hypothetical protein N7492_007965 [Penicillium capsulatum]|uniref:Zn(2)-C6 fungal-type domain-containing protein n=1 Tax=Penicillium capsulatum TaxID=69766 RepID=A0A9W9HR03_9EURO|nr:hypothetical protein N7492_007965 [Penicillium capsulatum]KAJ6105372.1 hypothetical protein N7512_008889 [Penicillium capsulatum]
MAIIGAAMLASPEPGILGARDEADGNSSTPVRKRKASGPIPSFSSKDRARQKITRACDSCKVKKTRCSGTLPCSRCTHLALSCRYNAAYSRGLPPDPLPASPTPSDHTERRSSQSSRSQPSAGIPTAREAVPPASRPGRPRQAVTARNSPEPGSTDFEGNYLGPSSGVSFINRVWSRLHQDENTRIPDHLQNESSKNTAVFMFGDKPYSHSEESDFALPPFDRAMELVSVYFDYSMVTYRFLHRGSVESWVRHAYDHNISVSNLPASNMVARTAIVLMIFAVGSLYRDLQPGGLPEGHSQSERWFAASKYMASLESGPPRLETIQVRLIQCLYLLSSSRANECWYSFGTALQAVTALGLHRKWPVKLSKNGCSYLELELRKRIFWSVYTLDKYLSIMFGRPRLLHDEDIDQQFPNETNDEDLLEEDPIRRTGSTDSMMIASVLHYRLGRILGDISRQLYSINSLTRDSPLETAARLTSELERWKESVPPLFNSVRPSSLIPPLCRQSQVLQLAYSHAMIHVTRSFLLNDFTDLSRRPRELRSMVGTHVQKCIQAAEDIMTLIDELAQQKIFIQSFWFTHYVCFCAILVVYIHIIQQRRQSLSPSSSAGSPVDSNEVQALFALAETCQQHLAEATRRNCPSRRYGIILEELRQEVHRQIGSYEQGHLAWTPALFEHDRPQPHEPSLIAHGTDRTNVFEPQDLDFAPMAGALQSSDPGAVNAADDTGLLENLEGSIWWAQLDSWALSSFPNGPSGFTF